MADGLMWQALENWEMVGELPDIIKASNTVITQEPVEAGVTDSMVYLLTTYVKLYLSPAEFAELITKGAS